MPDNSSPSMRPISESIPPRAEDAKAAMVQATASAVLKDGALLEMVYDPSKNRTAFSLFKDGTWREESSLIVGGLKLVPYAASNNLIQNGVVRFPSGPEEYGSQESLIKEIQSFIHHYLDVSPAFERLAAYYALFTWIHDSFNELPYLRARGDYGSGKTRFLLTIGSLCYKPIFASGASSVSPIFRMLDAFRGTLIIDEGDFRMSDEKAEVVKIFNNGNVRGFPVLRSEVGKSGEYNPHAYSVFGPKIMACRGPFEDRALESRFLTEELGQREFRKDLPINLPESFAAEATRLRNKLLLFRFRNFGKPRTPEKFVDDTLEPRLNQIFAPLLSIVEDEGTRAEIGNLARSFQKDLIADRGMDSEAQLLEIILAMIEAGESRLVVKDIAQWFADRHGDDYKKPITPKWVGGLIRQQLRLQTRKSDGVYVLPPEEWPKVARLAKKYGVRESEEAGPPPETASEDDARAQAQPA